MSIDEIKKIVNRIFLETFQDLDEDTFDFNRKQEEFENWDSLSHIELISKVENNFDISLEIGEVIGLNSPQNLVEIVEKKLRSK